MASIKNLKALNWDVVHKANEGLPSYPDELTDGFWKKKRSLLSKTVDTGLGKVLRSAEADFKKLEFIQVGGRNWGEVEESCKRVLASTKVNGKKANQIFKDVRDAAKKAADTLTKKKFKKDAKLATQLATWADIGIVTFNSNSLTGRIAESRDELRKKIYDGQKKKMDGVVKLAQGVSAKVTKVVSDQRKRIGPAFQIADEKAQKSELSDIGDKLRTACRDMSQPAVNFMKAHDMGIEMDARTFDLAKVKRFKEDISPLSDSQSQAALIRGRDEQAMLELCDTIDDFAARFKRDIETIKMPTL